ncbi:hypothetical protein, partial [Serratia quinivorans]|uniref:hypothetical protein n=1 Tax=Serratia quinivorans TaxID=137545 RepID=UPI0021BD1C5E
RQCHSSLVYLNGTKFNATSKDRGVENGATRANRSDNSGLVSAYGAAPFISDDPAFIIKCRLWGHSTANPGMIRPLQGVLAMSYVSLQIDFA